MSRIAVVGLVVALAAGALLSCTARLESELDRNKQKRTIADLRNVGTALMAWLVDALDEPASGVTVDATPTPEDTSTPEEGVVRLSDYQRVPYSEVMSLVAPTYMREPPRSDAWGHELEYYVNRHDLLGDRVILVRSPGRDGVFEGDEYREGQFDPAAADADLVWADGFFVRQPEDPTR
jgi:hypothetical protein